VESGASAQALGALGVASAPGAPILIDGTW
jgi:hypothetical protein